MDEVIIFRPLFVSEGQAPEIRSKRGQCSITIKEIEDTLIKVITFCLAYKNSGKKNRPKKKNGSHTGTFTNDGRFADMPICIYNSLVMS